MGRMAHVNRGTGRPVLPLRLSIILLLAGSVFQVVYAAAAQAQLQQQAQVAPDGHVPHQAGKIHHAQQHKQAPFQQVAADAATQSAKHHHGAHDIGAIRSSNRTQRALLQDPRQQQQQQQFGMPSSPSPSPSPAAAAAAPGSTVIIIQAPPPSSGAPSGSPQVPSPPTPSPGSVTTSPSSTSMTAVKPTEPRPEEGIPDGLLQGAAGGAADTITVSMVVKGVTAELFNTNLKAPAATTTATISGTPVDRWSMTLQQQQQTGRRLQQQQQQQSARRLLQQQGVKVVLSLYTTSPQIVWFRLAKMPPSAGNSTGFSSCTTEYCSRLVAAGIPVDPSSIVVSPSYDNLLQTSNGQNGPGPDAVAKALQVNTNALQVTRSAAWQGALAVVGLLLIVVAIWKRRAIAAWYRRVFGTSTSNRRLAAASKKKVKHDKHKRGDSSRKKKGSRDAEPPSPQPSSRPSTDLTTTSELPTSELDARTASDLATTSEQTASDRYSDQASDLPVDDDDESDDADSDAAADADEVLVLPAPSRPTAAAAAAGQEKKVAARSSSPLPVQKQKQQQQQDDMVVTVQPDYTAKVEEPYKNPVPPQTIRFDTAEKQKWKVAAAAAVAAAAPGPRSPRSRSRSSSSSSGTRINSSDGSVSSKGSMVMSESSSMAAAAAARKLSLDEPDDGPVPVTGLQNAALAVAYKSSGYDDTASESSSQFHEIEVATGKIKSSRAASASKAQMLRQQQQERWQQQRGVRSLEPLEQQALANYFGRMKQQQQQTQMVPYRTSSGLSAARLAELDQQQQE